MCVFLAMIMNVPGRETSDSYTMSFKVKDSSKIAVIKMTNACFDVSTTASGVKLN